MNLKRAIGGFLLSFVFLVVFMYMFSGIRWVLVHPLNGQDGGVALGDISGGLQNVSAQDMTQDNIKPADETEVVAESAISVESNLSGSRKVIFNKFSDKKLPIASLTKLMTAIIVLDNYNLSDTITVSEVADAQDPMKEDVELGDSMPVESFLDLMLVRSSNKSAYALSELIGEKEFVALMNQKSEEIGLKNTFFVDPTGLSSENISTARELEMLAEYILKNYPKIADISKVKEFYVPYFGSVENTDELLGQLPNVVFSKTGFTIEANGCLLLVLNNPENSDYLINIILGADHRFLEMQKLISCTGVICK